MLEITTQELRRCDVVRAKGRVDSGTVSDLKAAFDSITEANRFKIVFNMEEVAFMSSAGLRQMIETMKTCKRFNRGDLILAAVPANMKDVLELAGLTPIFKVYNSEVEAVGSF
jgi:anti-sigma B factor antagonist